MVFINMNKKKLIYGILVVVFIAVWHYLFRYPSKKSSEISLILGIDNAKVESFEYSDELAIKDYDTVEKYRLSSKTISSFLTSSSLILYDGEYEKKDTTLWKKMNWTKGPMDTIKDYDMYELIFNSKREEEKRDRWIQESKEILLSSYGYYSFYKKKTDNYFKLFVLDIKCNILYIITLKL